MKALEIDHNDDGKSDGDQEEAEREDDVKQNYASTTSSLSEEIRSALADWTMSLVISGLVVSFWRGAWTLIDIMACDQPATATLAKGETFCLVGQGPRWQTAWYSYAAGNGLLILALLLQQSGGWAPAMATTMTTTKSQAGAKRRRIQQTRRRQQRWIDPRTTLVRLTLVYLLGMATVNIWRGIWYILDAALTWPSTVPLSYWTSALLGLSVCTLALCGTASLLAPPAIFLMDGPSMLPPPLAVTLLASYRSITINVVNASSPAKTTIASVDAVPGPPTTTQLPSESWPVYVVDCVASFVLLPWAVVAFWRGCWYSMDYYLWGLTVDDGAIYRSIAYGVVVSLACLVVASEDVVLCLPTTKFRWGNHIVGRLRSLVLAVGAVNFWRAVWYIWDEFLGQSTIWSALLSHFIGLVGLLLLGCLSCIAAPPSTLGVDAIANEGSPDEPLFHNVPVPAEALFMLGMARQPSPEVVAAVEAAAASSLSLPADTSRSGMLLASQRRFISSQSVAHLQMAPRGSETATLDHILSARSAAKRMKSQYFRSR